MYGILYFLVLVHLRYMCKYWIFICNCTRALVRVLLCYGALEIVNVIIIIIIIIIIYLFIYLLMYEFMINKQNK